MTTALAFAPLTVVATAQAQEVPSVRATRDDDQPVTAPADALGAPSASTVVSAANLFIEQRADATTSSGTTVIPDGGVADVSGVEPFRADLNPQVPTAAGRFLDPRKAQPAIVDFDPDSNPDPERVASLRHQDTGGDGLLTLSYRFPAEGPRGATLQQGAAAQVGGTYAFSPLSTGTGAGVYLAAPVEQPLGFAAPVTTVAAPGPTVPLAVGQWALIAAADGSDAVALMNRADGTCLDVLGDSDQAGAVIDAYPCNGQPNQLWDIEPVSDGTATLVSARSGLSLTAGTTGFTQEFSTGGPAQTFRIDAIVEPQGILPTFSVPQARDEALPSALAAGDLDRSVDSVGRYRDESVIAWADADRELTVAVIDHNANASHLLVSQTTLGITVGAEGFPGSVGVAIGDFDGAPSSRNEIGVTWQDGGGTIHASILSYSASDTGSIDGYGGTRTLSVPVPDTGPRIGAAGFPDAASLVGGLGHAAAGDLLNSRHQQLIVTWADDAGSGDAENVGNAHVGAFSFGSDLSVEAVSALQLTGDGLSATVYGNVVRQGLPVVTGLFKYGPTDTVATSYPLTRRQIAVGWGSDDRANFRTVDAVVAKDGTSFTLVPLSQPVYLDEITSGELAPGRPIALAAGGFAGQGAPDEVPLWGIAATSTPLNAPPVTTRWSIDPASYQVVGGAVVPVAGSPSGEADASLTAFDQQDLSLRVGAPVTLTIENQPVVQVIGAEPPTHADYLPGNELADENGFVNLDQGYGFALTLGRTTDSTATVAYTASTTGSIGTTDSLDVKESVKTGIPDLIGFKGSIDSTTKFKLQNDATSTRSSSDGVSTSVKQSATTSDDDVLFYHSQSSVIFRYPILGGRMTSGGQPIDGQACSPDCFGFFDIPVPLSVGQQALVPGTSVDASVGFSPSWQNGNALSYPSAPDTTDAGPVVLQPGGLPVFVDPEPTLYSVGRNASSTALDVSGVTNTSQGSSSSLTWNLDETVTAAAAVKVGVPGNNETTSLTASLGVNGGQTISKSVQGTTTNTTDSTFSISVPALNQDGHYNALSSSYYATSGIFKTVHGAQLPTNLAQAGAAFWTGAYGGPDPALNLPQALELITPNNASESPSVQFETGQDRQALRGFEVRQPVDTSGSLTSGAPYAAGDNPVGGTPVTFAVPVSNYSVGGSSPAGTVDFIAVAADGYFAKAKGATPVPIGRSVLPALSPGEQATVVSPPWVTPTSDGAENYLVFAQVNKDGADETHPLNGTPCPADAGLIDPLTGAVETLACGQNNQGYGELTVVPAPLSSIGLEASRAADVRPVGATFLASAAADRVDAGTAPAQLVEGALVRGQIQFAAEADTVVNQLVEIYDGPPADGRLVAVTTLRAADAGDVREAKYRWTPTGLGRHQLHQVVRSTAGGGDTWTQIVDVDVVPTDGDNAGGNGDGGGSDNGSAAGTGGDSPHPSADGRSHLAATGPSDLGALLLAGVALIIGGALTLRRRRTRT
jgi:LPXTG-motif cell wall-anchored protein